LPLKQYDSPLGTVIRNDPTSSFEQRKRKTRRASSERMEDVCCRPEALLALIRREDISLEPLCRRLRQSVAQIEPGTTSSVICSNKSQTALVQIRSRARLDRFHFSIAGDWDYAARAACQISGILAVRLPGSVAKTGSTGLIG